MNITTSLPLLAGLVIIYVLPTATDPNPSIRPPITTQVSSSFSVDTVLTTSLPPVYFCGESVPLHEETVARRLVYALTRHTAHNQFLYKIRQRASTFFPIIEPILARHHIPLDFKYLPLVESALRGFAVSSSGATGYWQFMPATARELGLVVRPGHDERRNLIKSTDAACRYLHYLHNHLGSWTLAAAAYNNGLGALLGNIRRQQQRDYYYLRLNAQTGKYLYRILAFKELFSNYRSYQDIIPESVLAYLSKPLTSDAETDETAVLLPEEVMNEVTRVAVNTSNEDPSSYSGDQSADIPLPNAADVFRGGIKARLIESASVQRGQVWVFNLTRAGMTDGQTVEEGDVLYAIVEDIDLKTNKVYLRADRLYSISEKHTYNLALTAIDASTGRTGIKVLDVDQVKAGWILTWKAL